ncbi:hypothetical protein PHLGIDRAFT_70177 [Phlebiopsis gigantea 11061_1 CR5-6]|uniref:G-patch domain-containing protein n=1 Tax=Phlebiopsis gigantea (strain 11061_1 CR5-6) TaxID=745531 RepID=A0A0C3S946_PHLG1|nr:hypothetical protein PHLGIDRAFT_70177 [Phlebiopsis gigantea 11061_1 CR5-6]
MAYNREWDKGKSNWADQSWSDYPQQGNVRGREDDYSGEGKRRKFNDGVCLHIGLFSWGQNSSRYGSLGYEIYNQGRNHTNIWSDNSKKRQFSEPSPHVIFLGLDPDFSEADHARAFVEPVFPFIDLPPPASHGASARAAFFKALEAGQQHNGRRVKIDYSSSANPAAKRGPTNMNDGTRDIGNVQGPVLLFRGLDPLSGPQAIAQAMKLSSGPGKEGAAGMRRIILIKDKVTMASWGFAFVEFVDVQSAAAVLGATMSPQIHPNGFRISERPVAASFAHPESFQPLPEYSIRDDACVASSPSLGGVEDIWVRYWDEGSTVAMLEFKVEQPLQQAVEQPTKEKKKKAKVDIKLDQPAKASALPVSDKPVTLSFKGALGQKTGLAAPVVLGFSLNEDEGEEGGDDEEGDRGGSATDKAVVAKKVAPMVASKKTANNITKWNQVQEELKEGLKEGPDTAAPEASTATVKVQPTTPAPAELEFEFSDTTAITCLLCARQFKTLDQLKRHNKESDLHKKNFKDANLREVAREKVKAAKAKAEQQPKYRDRASERRIMHNQPEIPLPEGGSAKGPAKKRHAEGPPPPPSPPPPAVNPGEDQSNVGNRMLRMMGWTEGTGLGQDREGRVEPVQTAIYAQGVGLGASKGKEIGKYAEGYTGYVQQAQEAVSASLHATSYC